MGQTRPEASAFFKGSQTFKDPKGANWPSLAVATKKPGIPTWVALVGNMGTKKNPRFAPPIVEHFGCPHLTLCGAPIKTSDPLRRALGKKKRLGAPRKLHGSEG